MVLELFVDVKFLERYISEKVPTYKRSFEIDAMKKYLDLIEKTTKESEFSEEVYSSYITALLNLNNFISEVRGNILHKSLDCLKKGASEESKSDLLLENLVYEELLKLERVLNHRTYSILK